MKNYVLPFIISIFCLSITSCSESDEPKLIEGINAIVPPSASFAPDDGAKALSKNPAEKVMDLLMSAGPKIIKSMGQMNITDSQYKEIKTFVDELAADQKTPYDIYRTIFTWITQNIQYASDYVDNDPYPVFQTKKAICQGYANLCKTMLLTQGIPAFGVNGYYAAYGAHAWLYAYVDKIWRVCDPTGYRQHGMSELNKYKNDLLVQRTEIEIFEDENFGYNYDEYRLNVCRVKKCNGEALTVPFSVAGFKISSFLLEHSLPSNVRQLYFGTNIQSLGTQGYPLFGRANSVEEAFVAPGNRLISSQDGVIYHGTGTNVYYIPTAIRRLVLKQMKVIGKNTVYDLPNLEEIVISEGTTTVESYAFESCPSLKRIYVPQSVTSFAKDALYRCPDDVEILKGSTGIHHMTM